MKTCEIKQQIDIISYIGQFIDLRKRGKNYLGLCPFHSEKSPSFSVNQEKQFYYCFGCHESGDVFDFIIKYHKTDFKTARDLLAAQAGIRLTTQSQADFQRIKEAKQRRKKEQEIANKLQTIINDEIKRLINIEKWIHRVTQLIQTPEILDLPVISWAVKQKEAVSFFLDELLQTNDVAAQLAIVRLSREVVKWKP